MCVCRYATNHGVLLACKKVPFEVKEQGWGQFELQIVLNFKDKSIKSKTLKHDLTFVEDHYEISHELVRTYACTVLAVNMPLTKTFASLGLSKCETEIFCFTHWCGKSFR